MHLKNNALATVIIKIVVGKPKQGKYQFML